MRGRWSLPHPSNGTSSRPQPRLRLVLAVLFCLALAIPSSIGNVTTIPPDSGQVKGAVSDAWATGDEALQGAGVPLGLPDSLTSLRANAMVETLGQRLEAYKQQLYNGALPLTDFDDVPLEDIGFQKGPLPPRAFYHTYSMEDVETRVEEGSGIGLGAAAVAGPNLPSPATVPDPVERQRVYDLQKAGLSGIDSGIALQPLPTTAPPPEPASNQSARMAELAKGDTGLDISIGPLPVDPALPPQRTTATTLGALLFSDDFNDNSLSPTKWTVLNAGYGVSETNNRLQMSVREQQETQAYVRSALIPQAFTSTTGVDATALMARNVAGGAWVANPSFTLVRSDDSSAWVRMGFDPFNNRVLLTDSAGTSTAILQNSGGTSLHAFRFTVLGTEYTASIDSGAGTTVSSSIFANAPGVRIEFIDTTGGSTAGAWETSVRDDVYVYEAHTGSSTGDAYEPDNGFSQYTSLTPGTSAQTQAHSLQPAGDEDFFRFYASTSNTYSFHATGSTDTFAHIYNAAQAQLAVDDDSGEGNNFLLTFTPTTAGYHFLRVRGYSGTTAGDYTLGYSMSVPNGAPARPSTPSGAGNGLPSVSYTYSSSATDPEGNQVRYMFDWGDGTSTWTSYTTSGTALSASHSWSFGGTYYVYVLAQDASGASSTWSPYKAVTISAANGAPFTPSAPLGPSSGIAETAYSFTASASDPDGDDLQFEFEWGEGGSSLSPAYPSGSTIRAAHTWVSAGDFSVRVRAVDSGGLASAWSPHSAIAIEPAPIPATEVEEDFEASPVPGWTVSGLWHTTTRRAQSGASSLWYGLEDSGTYDTGGSNSGIAATPLFTVPDSSPYLVFDSWYQAEEGSCCDTKTVRIVSSNGVPLRTFSPLDHAQQRWQTVGYPLQNEAGQDVRIEFEFDTHDGRNNGLEGWFVDHVRVTGDDGTATSFDPDADTFTEITTEFTRDLVEGQSWASYKVDDEVQDADHLVRGGNDVMTKLFEYHAAAHEGATQAWLAVPAKASGCTADTTFSHLLAVNEVTIAAFEPCSWSTSQFHTLHFEVPVQYLQEGFNRFTITDQNVGARGLSLSTDTSYPGDYSEISVNGGPDAQGELMWTLWADRNSADFEVLYRFMTYRQVDEEGRTLDMHGYEAYTFFAPEQLDTLYVKWREEPDGTHHHLWSNNVWQKNAYFNTANQVSGWTHVTYDQQLESAPQSNKYYTWFRTNWEAKTSPDNTFDGGRYMQLVPAEPYSPGANKDTDGKQNPPAQGSASPDGNGWALNLRADAYYRTYQTKSYSHKVWDPNKDHKHQEVGAGLHLLDIDERVADIADGLDMGLAISEWIAEFIESKTLKQWLVKSLKIGFSGNIASYILSFAQTGDIASIGLQEKDYGGSSAYTTVPVTVLSVVPPVIGWSLPIDIQAPVHLVPDIGDHEWHKTFFEYDF